MGPSAADDEDRAVHLGGTRDHVLDVVGVARAVDVRVVAVVGLVLDVRDGDGDAALALLGGLVDLVERREVRVALLGQRLRDRRGERRLAVVDVTDGADVHVRLGALELLLRHDSPPYETFPTAPATRPIAIRAKILSSYCPLCPYSKRSGHTSPACVTW
jgi:hypothetical protein